MIHNSQIVSDIKKLFQAKILTVKQIISKRQQYIRALDIDNNLKYTKVDELKKLPQTPELVKLIKCKESINYRFKELRRMNKLNAPNRLMYDLIVAYNKEVQKDVLLGELAYIGKSFARVRTVLVKRKFNSQKRRIDWDKSFYVLESIAKDVAPDIYEEYTQKKILRNKFIDKMRPFVYSRDNPNLPKWLVDHVDDILPYIKVRINKWHKNHASYIFIPTNFINDKVRSQVAFTDNCTDIKEILNTEIMGTRDKLFALCRYDNNMINKYIDLKYF